MKKFINLKRPILITGESGTGKTYLAKKIFERSMISKERFIHVHLTSLQDELFASEFFGHRKGSFTGAHSNSRGYLEEVGEGTLFLDEIGDLSLSSQKKLLFLIEEGSYYSVGSCEAKKFRGRLIMATRRDLKKLVDDKKFREDLYFRLMLFNINLIPLREKRDILHSQINYYLEFFKKAYQRPYLELSTRAREWMEEYSWPGNTRELKNFMEYTTFMASETIEKEHFPNWIRQNSSKRTFSENYHKSMESFEKEYILSSLYKFQGAINRTSTSIGLSKSTLIAKIKKYGINIWAIKAKAKENVLQG